MNKINNEIKNLNNNNTERNFSTQCTWVKDFIDKKEIEQTNKRCFKCWLDINERCICSKINELKFSKTIKFIVYMDYKEYLNPGDDAKLLLCACPNQTELVLYPHQDEKLLNLLNLNSNSTNKKNCFNSCILFPSSMAISYNEFADLCKQQDISWIKSLENDRKLDNNTIDTNTNIKNNYYESESSEYLTIIVIDAVWRHARKMAAHLRNIIPDTRHVQLTPEQFSIYARTQSQPDRICSIEALALYLSISGEDKTTCNSLIDLVKLNNSSLKRKK